jgi:nicotinamide mononucleotide adenylyltransferase
MRTAVMPLSTMETHSTVVARVNNERNQMQHRVFVISDLQVPYHDVKAVASVAQMLADFKTDNDTVVTIGDEQDFQTISRWEYGYSVRVRG